ncbi:tail fiber assembly protein [Serratia ureilytica]|uniref:tail fiber assembly protein n=1 Tax=Serratia TaxID=613 RepID=UPI001F4C67BB|nr:MULTISPECIES: tail fiber assembly protein [Serratia]MDP8634760.1 tail fiber assembly protein [Serratia marcescens]MDP8868261.1 tail fiber assembly protein [Serratia marcescens]UNE45501.1 tail fiber assembly protein [Serratia ureilytica]
MQHIKNLKRYTPEELFLGENVIYLQDDNGIDWYAAQKLFSPDTVKLAYDESGIICAINRDVSMLWPIGLSVIELNPTKLPKRCLANGEWVFDGKKVSQRAYSAEEMMARAEARKNELLAVAGKAVAPLQDAVDLDMATEAEKALLADWKKYRVTLNRLDMSAPDIDWPMAPAA